MSQGQGVEENKEINSIIFFPSQSPFIDFKDKGNGFTLEMNEKLPTAEMDILPILPFCELISFPYFFCSI